VTRSELAAIMRNPPPGWGLLFARVPGPRASKVRCLLCGRSGYGLFGPSAGFADFRGVPSRPAPWQAKCIGGHSVQCVRCRRPFVSGLAVASHQRCKSHHACCLDHTTVPLWANPFHRPEASAPGDPAPTPASFHIS